MKRRSYVQCLAGGVLLAVLVGCKPDYSVVQPVAASPTLAEPAPTINYRIKRKTATGNCYTNVSTGYEYLRGQLVSREVLLGADRGGGPPVQLFTYDATDRMIKSSYQLMVPAQDGVTAFVNVYNYTGNRAEKRTDVVRGGQIDNTNYNLSSFQYDIVDGVTNSVVETYKEQDGRSMKAYFRYTYANGNLTRWTITSNNSTIPASDFSYTYDDKPNPFKGRWLPEPSYLNGRNNVVSITVKTSQTPNGIVTPVEYTYNEKGYPITMLNSDGCSTQFEYETY